MSILEELFGLSVFNQEYITPSTENNGDSNLGIGAEFKENGLILHYSQQLKYEAMMALLESEHLLSTRNIDVFTKPKSKLDYSQVDMASFLNRIQNLDESKPKEIKFFIPYENFKHEIKKKLRNRFAMHPAGNESTKISPDIFPTISEVRSNTIRHCENYLKSPESYPHLDGETQEEIRDYLLSLKELRQPLNQERYVRQIDRLKKHGRVSSEYINAFPKKYNQRYIRADNSYENDLVMPGITLAATGLALGMMTGNPIIAIGVPTTVVVIMVANEHGELTEQSIDLPIFLSAMQVPLPVSSNKSFRKREQKRAQLRDVDALLGV